MTDTTGLSMSPSVAAPVSLRAATGQFRVVVDSEILLIAASASGAPPWTVLQRGAEGSTAATHASGASVYHYLTAGALAAMPIGASQLPASVMTDTSASPKGINSTGVINGQVLAYNSGTGRFQPTTVASGASDGIYRPSGLKADGKCVTDAAITTLSNQLSSVSAAFTSADQGKLIAVQGAGAVVSALTSAPVAPSGVTPPTWTQTAGGYSCIGASFKNSGGTPTKVQEGYVNSAVGVTSTVTLSGVVAGHSLLLYAAGWNTGVSVAITDNVAGTWTQVIRTDGPEGPQVYFLCASSPGGNVTVTITLGASGEVSATCYEWSNLGAVDQTGTSSGASSTTITPPTIAYSANDLVILAELSANAPTAAPGTGWTVDLGGTWYSVRAAQLAWQIASSAGNTNGQIVSIPLTTGLSAAIPGGAVVLTDGTRSQTFATPGAAASATVLPVVAQTAAYTFASGSTVKTVKPPLITTISSVASGVATLAVNATTTVSGAVCFYASDDTTAMQAALTSAPSGATIQWPDSFIGINGTLTSSKAVTITGVSCKPLYGSLNSNGLNAQNFPTVAPFLAGTVLWQFAPATDALRLSSIGNTQDLERFGILFTGMHYNTGHGVNAAGTGTYSGHPDLGPIDCDWDHVYVFGHDGAHYGFLTQNAELHRWGKLRAWGGGGLLIRQNSVEGYCGNHTGQDIFTYVFSAGPAHALLIDDQSTALGGGAFDFSVFVRFQAWVGVPSPVIPGTLAPAPNSQQALIAVNGQINSASAAQGFQFVAPDLETTVNAPVSSNPGLFTVSATAGVPRQSY